MHIDQVFDKINELLEDTDYPVRISNMADLDDFVGNGSNRRFEQYDAINRMHDVLTSKPESYR